MSKDMKGRGLALQTDERRHCSTRTNQCKCPKAGARLACQATARSVWPEWSGDRESSSRTEKAENFEVRSKKEAGNWITHGLVGNCKYLNFYSEWNREPLEVFEQDSNMKKLVFQKVPADCYIEKRWEAVGSEGWIRVEAETKSGNTETILGRYSGSLARGGCSGVGKKLSNSGYILKVTLTG